LTYSPLKNQNSIITMTRYNHSLIGLLLLFGCLLSTHKAINAQNMPISPILWIELDKGLLFCEIDASQKSIVNDSKLTILKIDPSVFDFQLLTSTEYGNKARTASQWAKEFGMEIIVNAGMYSFAKGQPNKGYLKNFEHVNNPRMSAYYNAMMVLHPKDTTYLPFEIIDLTCNSWDSIKGGFHSFCQGMRMLDCNGCPMAWDKKPAQSCSMVITATDIDRNIYFIFSRSPYTHQTMIKFLMELPFNLRQTVYLEGGPEASLYVNTGKDSIYKFGSYISKSWERDDNDHFWEIPNVIGIRKLR
jgi:hypothetical protein